MNFLGKLHAKRQLFIQRLHIPGTISSKIDSVGEQKIEHIFRVIFYCILNWHLQHLQKIQKDKYLYNSCTYRIRTICEKLCYFYMLNSHLQNTKL